MEYVPEKSFAAQMSPWRRDSGGTCAVCRNALGAEKQDMKKGNLDRLPFFICFQFAFLRLKRCKLTLDLLRPVFLALANISLITEFRHLLCL